MFHGLGATADVVDAMLPHPCRGPCSNIFVLTPQHSPFQLLGTTCFLCAGTRQHTFARETQLSGHLESGSAASLVWICGCSTGPNAQLS